MGLDGIGWIGSSQQVVKSRLEATASGVRAKGGARCQSYANHD